MSKKISCKEMGVECDFKIEAETAGEAKMKLIEHAQEKHKDKLKDMSPTEMEEMLKKIDEILKD